MLRSAVVRSARTPNQRIIFNSGSRSHISSHSQANSVQRRSVTVINDNGNVPWKELTAREKVARTTQQTFNLSIVLLGLAMTGGVATVLYLEVFSTDSKTAIFNRTADRVRKDARCKAVLVGEGLHSTREISAHGEPSWSRWTRNRTIASRIEKDRAGIEHLHMHFYVEGPLNKGTVTVHMTRRANEKEFQYRTLALDVPGYTRIYLEDSTVDAYKHDEKSKIFGIRWS